MKSKIKYSLINYKTKDILFEGWFNSLKDCVEQAVSDRIPLDHVDLSGVNLAHANLDDARMSGASLRGTNLQGANLSEAVFDHADFSDADVTHACFALSSLIKVNFYGASFSCTDMTDAVISGCQFSCPSVFSTLFGRAALFTDCHYTHEHRDYYEMSRPPVVVSGLPRDIVVLDHVIKIGQDFIPKSRLRAIGLPRLMHAYGTDVSDFLSTVLRDQRAAA